MPGAYITKQQVQFCRMVNGEEVASWCSQIRSYCQTVIYSTKHEHLNNDALVNNNVAKLIQCIHGPTSLYSVPCELRVT